ncbi:unnamed protein product [Polarella glacialis]|uniref:catechol O-methyltransferase n=1 Tax=Polarella glacialis TaxID=89957 RepID=A0A813E5Q2_POLGL|nr:unnamed protein product [Polarella glacialis]
MRFGDGHTMFWALERGLDFTSLWLEFDSWVAGRPATDVLDLGIMLPGCEALRDAHREQRVWQLICSLSTLRRDVQEIVSGVTGNARNPLAYIDKQSVGIDFLGAQVARHGGHAQHKLAMLVQHVEAVLSRGPRVADDVLEAIVEFSMKKFNYWLKVAADVKGTLLNYALDHAKAAQGRVRMELGAYVGYSGLRLSGAVRAERVRPEAWRVLSLEVDPLHVCIARHMLNLGERSGLAEVRTGQVRDLLPKVVDDFGQLSVGLVFMDHRGTRFHEELRLFEREAMLCTQADIICDNVLHPGAPVFLWEETRPGSNRRATVWSLPEFGGEGCIEDWMAFERYEPRQPRSSSMRDPSIGVTKTKGAVQLLLFLSLFIVVLFQKNRQISSNNRTLNYLLIVPHLKQPTLQLILDQ